MEKFDIIYDEMTRNYAALEQIMGAIYEQGQNTALDENSHTLLQGLGDVAQMMLASQIDFVESYGDPSVKASTTALLDAKKEALIKALEDTKEKNRK